MARPAVVVALPPGEAEPVSARLREDGYDAIGVDCAEDLERLLAARRDVGLAIIDVENDIQCAQGLYAVLHETNRGIPTLIVVSPQSLERLAEESPANPDDEYLTRPYSADTVRWRVEAMLIRSQTVDDGSGDVLQSAPIDTSDWARRATMVLAFNPKGGVGKTTLAVNLAATLQVRHAQRVLLVDADTVTGHVASSLGLERVRTAAAAWTDEEEGGPHETLLAVASTHSTGMKVVVLTSSPLHTDLLEPRRVAGEVNQSRRGFDFVVVDMHPDYGPLNRALFENADRILLPVTPDVPAIRAAVQFRDVAKELGIDDRVGMVINRANSGVSVEDMEHTIGMPAFAEIRSAGMCLVRAANEGRTLVERFPREKITEDFDELARRIVNPSRQAPAPARQALHVFGRHKEQPVRA